MKNYLLLGCALLSFNLLSAQDSTTALPPGWWGIPKTDVRVTIGGYVKFDLIQDFNPIGSTNFFDVSKIPTNGSKGTNTNLQANETRLNLDIRSPFRKAGLRAFVEGDFQGSGNSFRLRHAFIEVNDRFLAGQTWSNFMDENILPPTLDSEKPAAYAFARHGMIRYKLPLNESNYIAVALEQPYINAQAPASPGKLESFVPDLTARYRLTKKWGHLQLSAFSGIVRFRRDSGSTENTNIFGVNLSGQLNFCKRDMFIYQVIAGPGVTRYRSGEFAAPDENDNLEAIMGVGYTAGVRHFWNDKWSTMLVANYGTEENTSGQPGSAVKEVLYSAVNVIWQFHKNAFVGVEYLYGVRKDNNDNDGDANRIQFSMKYDINKH